MKGLSWTMEVSLFLDDDDRVNFDYLKGQLEYLQHGASLSLQLSQPGIRIIYAE